LKIIKVTIDKIEDREISSFINRIKNKETITSKRKKNKIEDKVRKESNFTK